jgi:HlyD family type I secretion membrane fusion protein
MSIAPIKGPDDPRTLPAKRDSAGKGVARRGADEKAIAQLINDFQSDTAEITGRPEPFLVRSLVYLLTAMVVSAIVWASFAEIDRVVSARGKLVSTVPLMSVQPLETSIIKSLHAQPGDTVKAGQPLATLDPTFAQSDVDQIQNRLSAMEEQIARLQAELDGKPYTPAGDSPTEAALTQMTLWRERQSQLRSQLLSYDERIARAKSSLESRDREIALMTRRLEDIKSIETIRKELFQAQVGSKLGALQASSERLNAEQSLASLTNEKMELGHELDDLKAQRAAFESEWRNDISQRLVQARVERDGLTDELVKAQKRRELVNLTAPVDAVVLELARNQSVNSVVRGADPLFVLVPLNAPVEVQAGIDGSEIGYIREGDPVEIKLDSYNYQTHGSLRGVVRTISSDAFTSQEDNALAASNPAGQQTGRQTGFVYRARIEITENSLRDVPGDLRLIPGMPLSAEIKVGHRTVMSYLLRPILRGFGESMREP